MRYGGAGDTMGRICEWLYTRECMLFFSQFRFRIGAAAVIVLLLVAGAWYIHGRSTPSAYQTPDEADPYVRFDMEAFDLISENYWIKPGDYARFGVPELPQLFSLALQDQTAGAYASATSTRTATAAMLGKAFRSATSTDARRALALQTLGLILNSLPPAGRDSILSTKQETDLRQDVANVNPGNDLYQDLGLARGASEVEVDHAYQEKAATLQASTSPDAKTQLQKVSYAHEVLASPVGKQLYDNGGVEPSVFTHVLGNTLYLDVDKISPTALQEFAFAVDAASTTPRLDSMIIDFRGNVGGALDFTQGFLGLFIGTNQYAFDLYHQGDNEVARTTQPKFDELSRYADIAILTDNMTQSTAELTTAVFKRFHLARVVGTTTRGWGSVENTYPLRTSIDPSTSYSLLLVNSLTLRDDNAPIESNGVVPDIDTSRSGWQNTLADHFRSSSLIRALIEEAAKPPLR